MPKSHGERAGRSCCCRRTDAAEFRKNLSGWIREMPLGTGHRDIEEAALFLDLRSLAGGHVGGDLPSTRFCT